MPPADVLALAAVALRRVALHGCNYGLAPPCECCDACHARRALLAVEEARGKAEVLWLVQDGEWKDDAEHEEQHGPDYHYCKYRDGSDRCRRVLVVPLPSEEVPSGRKEQP